jgi:hypothetical protein
MKRVTASIVIAALLVLHTSMASAREVPGIAGVRLGMTSATVLGLLRAKNIAAQTIFKPCLRDYLAMHANVVGISGPGHCPEVIQAKFGGDITYFSNRGRPAET